MIHSVFLIKNLANGGLAEKGYFLELDFTMVDNVEISINDGDWIKISGTDPWHYRWDTTLIENGEYTVRTRSSRGPDRSEEKSIIVIVDQSSEEPGFLVYALLLFMLGVLSLILISVVVSTFNVKR